MQLLAHVQAEEARARRGKLRIFFGAAAGVGKTYAMLEAARARARQRASTSSSATSSRTAARDRARCSKGSSCCRRCRCAIAASTLQEFDLDAALARRPAILLVDELAHTNVDGEPRRARQALAGRRGAARRRHRRLDDASTSSTSRASTTSSRRSPACACARRCPTHLRRGRRGRAGRPAARRAARAPARRQGLRAGAGGDGRRALLPQGELIALRELALRRTAERVERRRGRRSRRSHARAPGWRAIACWSRSVRTRRPSSSCAPASAWPTRSMREWTVVYVETPELLRCRTPSAIGASTCCGSPSRSAPRRSRSTGRPPRQRCSSMRARATRRASSSARRSAAAGARGCGRRRRPNSCARRAGFDVITIGAAGATRCRRARVRERDGCERRARRSTGSAMPGRWRSTLVCTAVAFAMYPVLRARRTS